MCIIRDCDLRHMALIRDGTHNETCYNVQPTDEFD